MNTVAIILLLIFTVSWFLLAMLPALRELVQKTDAQPLTVHADYAGDTAHFARSSLEFLSANFPGRMLKQRGDRLEGLLANGNPYTLVPYSTEEVRLERHELVAHSVDRVLLSYAPLRVPAGAAALATIYCARDVTGEAGCVYRSVFCENDVALDDYSVVLRWLHAEGYVVVGSNTSLFGRASAGRGIRVAVGGRFQRLAAPRIEFGEPTGYREPVASLLTPAEVPHLPDVRIPRDVVRGSVVVPPHSLVSHDIVSSGSIRIGHGCWIAGSLKAREDVFVDGHARIDGSVVAQRDIFIGVQSSVHGPVIAERNILIDGPGRVGTEARPTTVTAPSIYFSSGVVVFGTVWARDDGAVEAAAADDEGAAAHVA